MNAIVRHAVAAVAMIAVFGFELVGVPACWRTPDLSADALGRVDRLLAHGEFSAALPLALENRTRYPAEGAAAWQVARAYGGLGSRTEEAAAWEVYLRQAPPTTDVCIRLSDVYRELAQPAQVIAIVNRCLALDDRQPELLGDLAAASLALGDRALAVTALKRALAIDEAQPRLRAQLRHLEDEGR